LSLINERLLEIPLLVIALEWIWLGAALLIAEYHAAAKVE